MTEPRNAVPVRIQSPSGRGCDVQRLEVAGVNVARQSRSFVLAASVDTLATLDLNMLALDGFDVELPAVVTVHVQTLHEGDVEVTKVSDTVTRYRFTRKDGTA